MQAGGTLVFLCIERECCLLVLNLVSSTLSCIRRPRPRLAKPLSPGQHAKLTKHFQAPSARLVPGLYPLPRTKLLAQGTSNLHPSPSVLSLSLSSSRLLPASPPSLPPSLLSSLPSGLLLSTPLSPTHPPTHPRPHARSRARSRIRALSQALAQLLVLSCSSLSFSLSLFFFSFMCVCLSCSLAHPLASRLPEREVRATPGLPCLHRVPQAWECDIGRARCLQFHELCVDRYCPPDSHGRNQHQHLGSSM